MDPGITDKAPCHVHPFIGDLKPSAADQHTISLLPWQNISVTIDPTGR